MFYDIYKGSNRIGSVWAENCKVVNLSNNLTQYIFTIGTGISQRITAMMYDVTVLTIGGLVIVDEIQENSLTLSAVSSTL